MKKLFIILLLYSASLFATEYYVTNTDLGNGSSWGAAELLSNFNFNSLSAGDIVNVDGGSGDSLLYTEMEITISSASGTSGNPIIIRRSTDSGHNGRPVITQTTGSGDYALWVSGVSYVIIDGITFIQTTSSGSPSLQATMIENTFRVTMQNCIVYHPISKGLRLRGSDFPLIQNNKFYGNLGSLSGADTDNIHADNNNNSITIRGNWLWELGNNNSAGAHIDNIQTYLLQADVDTGISYIDHNFILSTGTSMTSMSLIDGGAIGGELRIFNNVFYDITSANSSRRINITNCGGNDTGGNNWVLKYFNNTHYFPNDIGGGVAFDTGDSAFVYNNIVYTYDQTYLTMMIDGATIDYIEADYNGYVRTRSDPYGWVNCSGQGSYSLTGWRSYLGSPNETHSQESTSSTYFDWVDSPPANDPQGYALDAGSNGIGDGLRLDDIRDWGFITDDYSGNARGTGSWDIGAFQYGASPPPATRPRRILIGSNGKMIMGSNGAILWGQ